MKATNNFMKAIEAFIEREKQTDELFAKCVEEQPKKTPQGCVNYILKEVKKSGVAGWTDEEIYGMAKHFYDEKELKDPGELRNTRVVVNHHVELSDEEKTQAKAKALAEYEKAEKEKLEKKAQKEKEIAVKRKEAERKALMEKRERERKMQLELFAM